MTKYRPQRGSLAEAAAEVVEISDFIDLVRHLRSQLPNASLNNVTVEPYGFDQLIGWNTHIVCVNGEACGFTDGPIARPNAPRSPAASS